MKRYTKTVLRKTGALDVVSRLTAASRVEIVLYHGLCEGSHPPEGFGKLMPIETFEHQIQTFIRYGKPLRLEDLAAPAANGIVVTFDDGYANNYELGLPILEKYGFPATVFAATGFIDKTVGLWSDWLEFLITSASRTDTVFHWRYASIRLDLASAGPQLIIAQLKRYLRGFPIGDVHEFLRELEGHLKVHYDWDVMPEILRPLEWDEIRAMKCSGLISIGAHTVSHPVLANCAPEVQEFEIRESKRRIEQELGEPCTLFAYPYGTPADYDAVTKEIVAAAGFDVAVSTRSGFNRSDRDLYELRRWGSDLSADELSYLVAGGPAVADYFGIRD